MVRVGLIGYGKMGQIIDAAALMLDDVEVVTRIDPHVPAADEKQITPEGVAHVDVCIDFSHPEAILGNIEKLSRLQVPMVIGTTGWYDEIDQVKALVEEQNTAVLYAQNFSVGMNLFIKIVAEAARRVNATGSYDVALCETHHRHKVDSPSGTARAIAEVLLDHTADKTAITCGNTVREIAPHELHVSSVRVGAVPGTHSVIFDSGQDTLTLTHQAHHRKAWAEGALEAARWLQGKRGFYNFSDIVEELRCNRQE